MRLTNACETIVVKSKKMKLILGLRYGYKEYTANIECRTVWCVVAQGVNQWMDCFY
jgi:hypothetical protein